MALSRRIARPLLASIFIAEGVDALRNPGGKAETAKAVVGPMSERVSFIPEDPETMVRLNGALQVGAGGLLAIGRFRRLASLALICSIIPTTYAGHRFWEETDESSRAEQQMQFLKNLGLLGGLILAALDTEGEPSLSWRARQRGRQLETALALGRAVTTSNSHRTASRAARVSKRQARKASGLGHQAHDRAVDVLHQTASSDLAHQIGTAAANLAAGATGTNVARQLKPGIEAAASSGVDVAGGILSTIGEHLPSR